MIRSEILTLIQNGIAGGGNAGDRLTAVDIDQALRASLHALQKSRPVYVDGSASLVAGMGRYATPADFVQFDHTAWGKGKKSYLHNVGVRPRIKTLSGTIALHPAPSIDQLSVWGSTLNYVYRAKHVLTETANECTLDDEDESLLLLRASAEVMRILATRNVVSPVQLSRGLGNVSTTGTPAAMFDRLMVEYRRQASCV